MEVAGGHRVERVVALGERPRSPVPDDHVAAAVLAGGDHALEVEVVERVVLDVGRQALHVGVERRTLGHRPAEQDARRLQAEVVVQPARPVPLHDEAPPVGGRRVGAPRLGRQGEVTLGPIRAQPLVGGRRAGAGAGHALSQPRSLSRRSAAPAGLRLIALRPTMRSKGGSVEARRRGRSSCGR